MLFLIFSSLALRFGLHDFSAIPRLIPLTKLSEDLQIIVPVSVVCSLIDEIEAGDI